MSLEILKNFHDEFIKCFQTTDKIETNLMICQMLLYATMDEEMKVYDAEDSHTNYFDDDKEYVHEFMKKLLSKFKTFTYELFPDVKKFVSDAIEICKKADNKGDILKLFRRMCRLSEKYENFNSLLFDEFYSYISKSKQKNSEWSPTTICKIFALLAKNYDIKTILDPCIGANRLAHYVCKIRNINPIVYGYDIVPVLIIMSYLDLVKMDVDNGIPINDAGVRHILVCKDMFTINTLDKLIDLCVCNPPYTKKLTGHDALEFVIKSMTLSKHGIFIFPSNQIRGRNTVDLQRELLKIAAIDRVITLGSGVFNGAGAGDICIMVCTNRSLSDSNETYVQHIPYKKYINRVPHSTGDVFKPELEKELIKMILRKENATVINPTENLNWCLETTLFNSDEDDITVLKRHADNEILQNFKNSKHELTFENIRQKILENEAKREFLRNIPDEHFKKVKLMDVFELLQTPIRYANKCNPGIYPLIGGKKTGETTNIDTYDVEVNDTERFYSIALITGGFINRQLINFSCSRSSCALKLKINNFNDDINLPLINCQLSNQYSWSNGISKTNFKEIEVYIYSP